MQYPPEHSVALFGIRLRPAQVAALSHVSEHQNSPEQEAAAIRLLLPYAPHIQRNDLTTFELTVNFHPDRITKSGRTVIREIMRSGVYWSQFVNNETNGLLGALPGDRRWQRESENFGGAYDELIDPLLRVTYGSMNLSGNPLGGWPRFGSSHFISSPAILPRCSFSVGNSLSPRSWIGSFGALLELFEKVKKVAEGRPKFVTDHYRPQRIDGAVEILIHGEFRLKDQIGLVLDPSFKGTDVGEAGKRIARNFGFTFQWGPKVESDPRKWRFSDRRQVASQLIRNMEDGDMCTAEWIGRAVASLGSEVDPKFRNGAATFLWNRLLLEGGMEHSSPELA